MLYSHSHERTLSTSPRLVDSTLWRNICWSRWILLIGLLCYFITQVTDAAPSVNKNHHSAFRQKRYDGDQDKNQMLITPESVMSIRLKRTSADQPHHRHHHHHHRRRAVEPLPTMRSVRRTQNTPASSEGIDPDDGVFTRYGGRR